MRPRGTVLIAGKPRRESGTTFPQRAGYPRFDVTSGSNNKVDGVALKPLLLCSLGRALTGRARASFASETVYQACKVYEELGHWDEKARAPTAAWHKWRAQLQNALKKGKGVRTPALISAYNKKSGRKPVPLGSWWDGGLLQYVAFRKHIFVPTYVALVRTTPTFRALQRQVEGGANRSDASHHFSRTG